MQQQSSEQQRAAMAAEAAHAAAEAAQATEEQRVGADTSIPIVDVISSTGSQIATRTWLLS
jgi:hypothetical protein